MALTDGALGRVIDPRFRRAGPHGSHARHASGMPFVCVLGPRSCFTDVLNAYNHSGLGGNEVADHRT